MPRAPPRARRASRAATEIDATANRLGTRARKKTYLMPITPTRAAAIRGPTTAPALSPARSRPAARPYAPLGTRETSSVSRAGERIPRDIHATARRIATCHSAVASPIAAVASAVRR